MLQRESSDFVSFFADCRKEVRIGTLVSGICPPKKPLSLAQNVGSFQLERPGVLRQKQHLSSMPACKGRPCCANPRFIVSK